MQVTCGDALIGSLSADDVRHDQPWTYGRFTPGPAYAQYVTLFDRERALSEAYERLPEEASDEARDAAHDAWLEALEAVNVLGLHCDGSKIRDFKIDARGECEFKLGW